MLTTCVSSSGFPFPFKPLVFTDRDGRRLYGTDGCVYRAAIMTKTYEKEKGRPDYLSIKNLLDSCFSIFFGLFFLFLRF